jgi:fluoroacetyl-CoA thioesterase
MRACVRTVVADSDTAVVVGSGDVPVLATPRLLALAEAATVRAVAPGLADGQTTVGTSATLEHTRASLVGADVTVEAELTEVAGRRLTFRFTAWQAACPGSAGSDRVAVGSGTVQRAVVDAAKFLQRAAAP